MSVFFESFCGLSCFECEYTTSHNCPGCIASGGQPFHGRCGIAECAKEMKIRFCGECYKFPCDLLTRYAYDEKHGDNGARLERCKEIKSALVSEARKGNNSIGFCGHHCDFCFLSQWCGGCRSDYNCCSFATLFPDGCPNAICASEKKLNGCYDCDELAECKKGYYEKDGEYIAKATALFINKHGEAVYTATLQKAIASGEDYPKSFDQSGSVENAISVLEKYISA